MAKAWLGATVRLALRNRRASEAGGEIARERYRKNQT
jgi:hypothetical protein